MVLPVEQTVKNMIDLSLQAETDFFNTRLQLNTQFKAWFENYQTKAAYLRSKLEKTLSLNGTAEVFLMNVSDADIVREGIDALDEMLLRLANTGTPIPDEEFTTNHAIQNCNLIYTAIYGDPTIVSGSGWFVPLFDAEHPDAQPTASFVLLDTAPVANTPKTDYLYVFTGVEPGRWAPGVLNGSPIVKEDKVIHYPIKFGYDTCTLEIQYDTEEPVVVYKDGVRIGISCKDVKILNLKALTIAEKPMLITKWDPDYDWYQHQTTLKNLQYELSCKWFWKGWFGTGRYHTTSCIDDLKTLSFLRDRNWHQNTNNFSRRLIGELGCVDPDLLLNNITAKTQYKALFQVGNIWAVRHALINVLFSQLKGIIRKAEV